MNRDNIFLIILVGLKFVVLGVFNIFLLSEGRNIVEVIFTIIIVVVFFFKCCERNIFSNNMVEIFNLFYER